MTTTSVPPPQHTTQRPPVGLFLVLTGATIALLPLAQPSEAVGLVLAVTAVVVLALGGLFLTTKGAPWRALVRLDLMPWWLVYTAVTFGLTSLAWLKPQTGTSAIIRQESVTPAVLMVAVSIVAFLAGAFSGCAIVVQRPLAAVARWSLRGAGAGMRTPSIPAIVYAVGFVARLWRIGAGTYAYLGDARRALSEPSSGNQLLAQVENFTHYGLVLMALNAFALRRTLGSRILFWSALAVEVVFGAVSGVKGELVVTFLAVGIGCVAAGHRIPIRAVVIFAAGFLLLVPANLAYRQEIVTTVNSGSGSALDVVGRLPTLARDSLAGQGSFSTLRESVAFAAQRLREIDNVALIMQRTPGEIPYRQTTGLLVGPVAGMVPRAVWPDKPILSTGYEFSQQYYNLPPSIYTASAVTVQGDLYRHGGLPVMIIGMLLLGAVAKAAQAVYAHGDPRLSVLYAGLFLQLTNVEIDVVSLAVSTVQVIVVLAILTKVSFGRRR